jgi:excisionase family DNA binding protein
MAFITAHLPEGITQRGLSRQQAAAYLGVSLDILRQLTERGDIARVPLPGRTVRYDRAALDRWLDRASGLDAAPPTAAAMTSETQKWLEAIDK